jgi:hypothetical protein
VATFWTNCLFPVYSGYTFEGWYTEIEGSEPVAALLYMAAVSVATGAKGERNTEYFTGENI